MNLDLITKLIKLIDKIPTCTKTVIIVILGGLLFINYVETLNKDILREYKIFTEQQELIAEDYTLETASIINRCVSDIAHKDDSCSNVLLLSYHNTQKSLQGYRYLYLNLLTEKPKNIDITPAKEYWTNLEYLYYEDELTKIHNSEQLLISDIEEIRTTMPKIYKKLKVCEASSAYFYTIEGLKSPIGLVIILYKNRTDKPPVIYSEIQKLAVLLDYKNVSKQ